jgi:hypothetical protein
MRFSLLQRAAALALAAGVPAACTSVSGGAVYPSTAALKLQALAVNGGGVTFKAFTLPMTGVQPYDVALGENGNLYLSQPIGTPQTYLWQVSESGHITTIKPALGYTGPVGIAGAKGAVYFGLQHDNGEELGVYSAGKLTIKRVTGTPVNAIYFLTKANDGSIWFSDPGGFQAGHIVRGAYKAWQAPTKYCSPYGVAVGSDKNAWVAEQCQTTTGRIGRISSNGGWKEYTLPNQNEQPFGIAAGPDGNLWYTAPSDNSIGRITTAGKITEFSLNAVGYGTPYLITVGNDNALWFTVQLASRIGRITTKGSATEYAVPGCGSQCSVQLGGISAGTGRTIWFTNVIGGQVDRLSY